jgi:hypothetical protein
MSKLNSVIHLYDVCNDYIENTPEAKLNKTIYDSCIAYLSGNYVARDKEILNQYFNLQHY